MKAAIITSLIAGLQLAAAHSGVWTVEVDGNKYVF
jgi:hypothetical protein